MTSYATEQDFVNAFGEQVMVSLTNLDQPTAVTINTEKLQRCQADAKALIDSLIASSPLVASQMPFVIVPPLLRLLELAIVRYLLDSLSPSDDVRLRYEDAIKQARLIGDGKMSLGLAGSTPDLVLPSPAQDGRSADVVTYFGEGVLHGY